jgi:hypothetical protein
MISLARKTTLGAAALASALAMPAAAGTLMLGTYPDKLFTVDEATGKIGEKIQLPGGLPVSLRITPDQAKIFATTITNSSVIVMDAKSHGILTQFDLNTPTERYRFNGGAPDPTGRFFYTTLLRMDKLIDRWKVSKQMYAVIDIKLKKVVRTADLEPEDDALSGGYRAPMMVSPDGKSLYLFKDKVLVVDTAKLKVVDRIDVQKPESTGYANVAFGGGVESFQMTTGSELVSLFTAADPFVHNKVFGLGRFDLNTRKFKFTPMGPITTGMSGLEITPDGKTGYTVVTNGQTGNKRCEFWKFDMASLKLKDKVEFACRSRFQLGMSGDGTKLYIYGASYDIEVYDAQTMKLEKTWDLGADATMAGMLVLK